MTLRMHTISEAMSLNELTEEEAYFILRVAGHMGYDRAMAKLSPTIRRIRRRVLWLGGWEIPELVQWDDDKPAWDFSRAPMPVSFLGLLTVYTGWLQLKMRRAYLIVNWQKGYAYLSPNGTSGHERARVLWGKP